MNRRSGITCGGRSDELEAGKGQRDSYSRFVARNLCTFDVTFSDESTFHIGARSHSIEGFTVARFATRAGKAELKRAEAQIRADREDRYFVCLPLTGSLRVFQGRRDSPSPPGSAVFLTTAEPLRYQKMGDNDTVYFFLPRHFVEQRSLRAHESCGRSVAVQTGLKKLAIEMIIALERSAADMSASDLRGAVSCVGELFLLSLTDSAPLDSDISPVRASNLARAKRIVRERCADPDVTLSDIAGACGLSLRYLHDLFTSEGCTFRNYLMKERLELAHRLMQSSINVVSVTDVYLASGFRNHSHFSTAFRRHFSISPKDVLRARRGLGQVNVLHR